jgi:uncharacterized integral membrane protein
MRKTKIIIILIVSLLLLIVFIQNRQAVDTKLLFVTATMPLALLLIIALMLGSILGIVMTSYVLREHRKPRSLGEKQQ